MKSRLLRIFLQNLLIENILLKNLRDLLHTVHQYKHAGYLLLAACTNHTPFYCVLQNERGILKKLFGEKINLLMQGHLVSYATVFLIKTQITNQRVNNVRPGARLPIIIAPIAMAVSLNRLLGLPPSAGFK